MSNFLKETKIKVSEYKYRERDKQEAKSMKTENFQVLKNWKSTL